MILLALLAGCSVLPAPPLVAGESALVFEGAPPHNVLMISIDTLRRDRVGRYSGGGETPFLDGLLAEGVALDDHRSCSTWTYPSSVCAVGGLDLVAAGFVPQRTPEESFPIVDDAIATLAGQLSAREYETGLVTANTFLGAYLKADKGHRISVTLGLAPADEIAASGLEVLDELRQGAARPWFLHLHFMDPHMPYTPPEDYLEGLEALPPIRYDLSEQVGYGEASEVWDSLSEADRALLLEHAAVYYNGEIAYLDDQLAALFAALEDRGALDDTLVVLWSDHGEQFWDHGETAHGNAVYAEENAAIGGFWARDLAPGAWSDPTSHEDLVPTALTALGFPVPDAMDGVVIGGSEQPRPPRYALSFAYEAEHTSQAVDRDGLRLIYHWSGALELYDLAADPAEQVDLFESGHPEAAALWPLLEPRVEAVHATAEQPVPVWPSL